MSLPQFPDIEVYPEATSVSWQLPITESGVGLNLSASTFTAPVFNDGLLVGTLDLTATVKNPCVVKFAVPPLLLPLLGKYSTWRLSETPFFGQALCQGRIVKLQ